MQVKNPIVIQHAKKKENKYNYIKCEVSECSFMLKEIESKQPYGGCYHACKIGGIVSCSYWETIDPFRLFIAIEREKRK